MTLVSILAGGVALALAVPIAMLALEVAAAVLLRRPRRSLGVSQRPLIAVLVPAHNEAGCLRATLESLRGQLAGGDRALVIADNCDDDTAAIARESGMDVVERRDPERCGKGFALAYGLDELRPDPPDVVVVIDADCILEEDALAALATAAMSSGGPAQGAYRGVLPAEASPLARLSAFAFLLKNVIRPRGLARLGLPCLLTGSGMAFPWQVLRDASLATAHGVEDMKLSVDLALAGHLASHCEEARLAGRLYGDRAGVVQQRRRWEHGHLHAIFNDVPRLCRLAWRRRSVRLAALALELAVPPLALLAMGWFAAGALVLMSLSLGVAPTAARLVIAEGSLFASTLFVAWWYFGRHILSPATLARAPLYVLMKLPLYASYLTRPRREWAPAIRPDDRADGGTTAELAGVVLDAVTEAACVEYVVRASRAGRGGWIATLNLDQLRLTTRSAAFAALCADATLRVADGMPLVWASRLQRTPLPERVTGSNLIWSLSAAAAEDGLRVFLLGGADDTAALAAAALCRSFPTLVVAGTSNAQVDLVARPGDVDLLVETLRRAEPAIVYVALGKPKQEQLIARLRPHFPATWFIPVGVSFSFVSGTVARAPVWMQRLGLEWTHRLVQEPRRLARRYLVEGVPFGAALLLRSAWLGARRGSAARIDQAATKRHDTTAPPES